MRTPNAPLLVLWQNRVLPERTMAHRTTLEEERLTKGRGGKKPSGPKAAGSGDRDRIFELFQRWGYLEAKLDPLGFFGPFPYPELQSLSGEAADHAREVYSGSIGAEFMHLPEPERR